MIACASDSATPGARSKEIVVETSVPSWFTLAAVAACPIDEMASSGTIVRGVSLSATPVEGLRSAGLVGTAALADADVCPVVAVLPLAVPVAVVVDQLAGYEWALASAEHIHRR